MIRKESHFYAKMFADLAPSIFVIIFGDYVMVEPIDEGDEMKCFKIC